MQSLPFRPRSRLIAIAAARTTGADELHMKERRGA